MTSTRPPEGMPVLDAGAHRDAEAGSCLMEYVSVLAGERFTDRPSCTHPALAAIAWQVNDAVSSDARQQLATRAVTLIGLGHDSGVVDLPRDGSECGMGTARPVGEAFTGEDGDVLHQATAGLRVAVRAGIEDRHALRRAGGRHGKLPSPAPGPRARSDAPP